MWGDKESIQQKPPCQLLRSHSGSQERELECPVQSMGHRRGPEAGKCRFVGVMQDCSWNYPHHSYHGDDINKDKSGFNGLLMVAFSCIFLRKMINLWTHLWYISKIQFTWLQSRFRESEYKSLGDMSWKPLLLKTQSKL